MGVVRRSAQEGTLQVLLSPIYSPSPTAGDWWLLEYELGSVSRVYAIFTICQSLHKIQEQNFEYFDMIKGCLLTPAVFPANNTMVCSQALGIIYLEWSKDEATLLLFDDVTCKPCFFFQQDHWDCSKAVLD